MKTNNLPKAIPSLILSLCLMQTALTSPLLADPLVVNIDFGGLSTAEGWNLVSRIDDVINPVNLIDSTGADTGMVLNTNREWSGTNESGSGAVFDGFVTEATSDSLFGNDKDFGGYINPNPEIEITGMDPSASYTFTIFASRMGASDTRSATYTATGSNTVSGELNASENTSETLVLESIVPSADGTVIFDWQKAASNDNGTGFIYLGAMIIEATSSGNPVENPLPWGEGQTGDTVISPWFGAFEIAGNGWIDHNELIWIYVGDIADTDSMWLYSIYLEAWVWTDMDLFPLLYNSSTGSWVYYFLIPNSGVWEYDMSIGEWVFQPIG